MADSGPGQPRASAVLGQSAAWSPGRSARGASFSAWSGAPPVRSIVRDCIAASRTAASRTPPPPPPPMPPPPPTPPTPPPMPRPRPLRERWKTLLRARESMVSSALEEELSTPLRARDASSRSTCARRAFSSMAARTRGSTVSFCTARAYAPAPACCCCCCGGGGCCCCCCCCCAPVARSSSLPAAPRCNATGDDRPLGVGSSTCDSRLATADRTGEALGDSRPTEEPRRRRDSLGRIAPAA